MVDKNLNNSLENNYSKKILEKYKLSEISDNSSINNINLINKNNCKNKTNSFDGKITFIFNNGNKQQIDIKLALLGCPEILSKINFEKREYKLPNFIDQKNLLDYLSYINIINQNNDIEYIKINTREFNFKKLTNIANYFLNEKALEKMINLNILPNIDIENCINLINDAYFYINNKLTDNLLNIWKFYYEKLKTFIIKNFIEILNKQTNIYKLNKNLSQIILENYLSLEYFTNKKELKSDIIIKIIKFIGYIKDVNFDKNMNEIDSNDFFKLINNENKRLNLINVEELEKQTDSKSIINFTLDLYSLYNTENKNEIYQENIIEILNLQIYFKIKLNKQNNNLELSIKPKYHNKNNFFSFLSYVEIEKNKKINCFNLSSINSENFMIIFSVNDISMIINKFIKDDKKLNLKIIIKINIIESFLISYLINNFTNFYKSKYLYKISSNNLKNILTHNNLVLSDEEKLICLMNWCKIFFLIYF
jgi:hypothetical protein